MTFGGTSLAYDFNGNLTGDGTNTYTWNARNSLASVSGPVPASFAYDGLGRRQRKTVNGTSTDFLYDALNPVRELVGANSVDLLTGLGIDEYFTRVDSTSTQSMLRDSLGSTVSLVDSGGTVQTEYSYEPFGLGTVSGSSSGNELRYTGREADATGLYYYRARYYHPSSQRFVSEDPIEFLGGDTNLYGYVLNNPLAYVDPLGLEWQAVVGVSGLLGGVPLMAFGGGGANLIFTSSGQIGIQFTATASAGAGLYAGVGMQAGGGYSDCPTPGGLSISRVGQFDANAGWGVGSVGVSAQYDPKSAGAQVQRSIRGGVGYGVQASVGVSQVVTIATRPWFARKRNCECP